MSFRECYFSVFSISLFFIEITRQISGHDGFISTGTANLISSPTFHRSRRPAYREYLSIKSPLSRLISGLRFRQNRQVGQVYPTSRLSGPDFFGTHLPKNEKYPRDSISREFPTSYPLSISPFPARLSNHRKSRKYACKNICSILSNNFYFFLNQFPPRER